LEEERETVWLSQGYWIVVSGQRLGLLKEIVNLLGPVTLRQSHSLIYF